MTGRTGGQEMEHFTELEYGDLRVGSIGRSEYRITAAAVGQWRRTIEDAGGAGVPMSFSLTWFLHALRAALDGIPAGGVLMRHELTFHQEPTAGGTLETEVAIDDLYEKRGRSCVAFRLRSRSGAGRVAENRMHLIWPTGSVESAGREPVGSSAKARPPRPAPEGELLVEGAITQERIDVYADLSADYNPLHVDPAAGRASPFGSTIAHGPIPLGYLFRGIEATHGAGWVPGLQVDARFVAPSRPGDRVRALRVSPDEFALVRDDGRAAVVASVPVRADEVTA